MARQPKFRKPSTVRPRFFSALLLIPVSLYLIYLGPPISLVLGGLAALGIFIEWVLLCLKLRLRPLKKMTATLLGTGYLVVAILWLLHQLTVPEGWKVMYWLLFLVWSTDIFAYFGGSLLRGPKLAPSISPNKTWSGFVVGLAGGVFVGYTTSFWFVPGIFSLGFITVLVLISQVGDLLESLYKRWSDVKDTSALIPGHGGLLDRLDSLLAVGFTLAFWQIIISL